MLVGFFKREPSVVKFRGILHAQNFHTEFALCHLNAKKKQNQNQNCSMQEVADHVRFARFLQLPARALGDLWVKRTVGYWFELNIALQDHQGEELVTITM